MPFSSRCFLIRRTLRVDVMASRARSATDGQAAPLAGFVRHARDQQRSFSRCVTWSRVRLRTYSIAAHWLICVLLVAVACLTPYIFLRAFARGREGEP